MTLFDKFWLKFQPSGYDKDLVESALGIYQTNFNLNLDEESMDADVQGGSLFLNFADLGVVIRCFECGDINTAELISKVNPKVVVAFHDFEGATKYNFEPELYMQVYEDISGRNLSYAIYLFMQLLLGVAEPSEDEDFLEIASQLHPIETITKECA